LLELRFKNVIKESYLFSDPSSDIGHHTVRSRAEQQQQQQPQQQTACIGGACELADGVAVLQRVSFC